MWQAVGKLVSTLVSCRLCIRLLPVENVCHASLVEIREAAGKLTGPHFPGGDGAAQVRFAVAYEHRASVELKRMDVINAIVDQIPQVRIYFTNLLVLQAHTMRNMSAWGCL